jgi:ABC-type bacteriocin/lantibiotic exporter with double-glycine peptidase domain
VRAAALALLVGLLASCAHYTGQARPLASSELPDDEGWIRAAPTPTVLQRDYADCGAAALAMVAGRWHVDLSLDDAARALPRSEASGVRLGDLREVARARGLVAYVIEGNATILTHELGAGRPVIVGLLRPYGDNRGVNHYEVVVAIRQPVDAEGEVVTIDPASGWQVRPWAAFASEWQTAGSPTLVVVGAAHER